MVLRLCSLLVLALLAAACGEDEAPVGTEAGGPTSTTSVVDTTTTSEGDAEGLPFGLVRCSADVPWVSAPPERYRPEPVYTENEMPIDEVQAWAVEQPGYEGIWIDRAHQGWITVAFSRDADQRQADLEERFPGVGVVAVEVERTEAELVDLWNAASQAMAEAGFEVGGSHGVHTGLVQVWVGELTEERLAPLAPFAGPALCVEGVEPSDVIRPAPQPEAGDGWRLLATDRTGSPYRTGVATTDAQYDELWREAGLEGDRPAVDFDAEVVVWFGAVYGSGCEIRMDGVVFDHERRIVHGDFVIPGAHQGCHGDANPEAYVVAVERSAVPAAPFDVQLGAADPPAGAPEERTTVGEDLRAPGATIPG